MVILNGAPRSANPYSYKGEILRYAQNDKNCRLTAHWYKGKG